MGCCVGGAEECSLGDLGKQKKLGTSARPRVFGFLVFRRISDFPLKSLYHSTLLFALAMSTAVELETIEEPVWVEPDWPGLFKISTDGSCFKNGKPDAAAGVGVFFGKGDPR